MPAVLVASLASYSVFGQTYTISTFAGGGLPVNIPGTAAVLLLPSSVAVDGAGNLFFTNENVVLRMDAKTGLLTLVAGNGTLGFSGDNGPAASAQLNSPPGVAVDAAGNVYIADAANNRVRKVSNGVITTVAGSGPTGQFNGGYSGDNGPATSAQLAWPTGVAVDSAGNLYIDDYNNGTIRKVSNGVITTVAGGGSSLGDNGPATSARLQSPGGVAVDAAGNLYIADTYDERIRKVSNGVITTVAGNGTRGFGGNGGPATNASLASPSSVAVDAAGNLYITDYDSHHVRKVSNGVITNVAGNGVEGFTGDNGLATSASLSYPNGVAVDAAGNLYIADTVNKRIRKVSNAVITTVAGGGSALGDGGPAASAQLVGPSGVAVDSAGSLYIADSSSNRIRKVSNGVITTVAGISSPGPYDGGYGGDNGPATSAQLWNPGSVAVDAAGNVYIADTDNSRVRKVSNGVITTVAGSGMGGQSGDNGPATSAELESPSGIAVDAAGNLYIADLGRVRKVSNGVITTVAGGGTLSGDNVSATSAWLDPSGIAVDAAGNLYIADTDHNRIRKVANGAITTVAGNGTEGYSGDNGPATSAQLDWPTGVAVDSGGTLYIADWGNSCIRKVTNGVITTVAGTGTRAYSGDNGPAASAQLYWSKSLAVDSAGNLYVTDSVNDRIRILTSGASPCTYSVSPTSVQAPASGGNSTVTIQTTASCSWTVSGLPGWITVSGASSGTGSATVVLVFAPNSGASLNATISIASVSVPVTQRGVASPSINAGGVVNAASYAAGQPLAPGSIAAAYGAFLLTAPSVAAGSPLPTNLAGLSLQFGGTQAPLFFAGAGQANFQVPWELAGQSQSSLAAVLNGQAGAGQTVSLARFAPGIFSTNSQGAGQGAILDPSYILVDSSHPAIAGGTVVQIYCTGLGPVTNQPPTGSPASSSPVSTTPTNPTVTIGGAQATVTFSGLAPGFVGAYQVNALVPAGSSKGAAVPVVIAIGGATSNTVTIAVQ